MNLTTDQLLRLEAARMAAPRSSGPHDFGNMANSIYAFLIEKPRTPAAAPRKKAATKKKAVRKTKGKPGPLPSLPLFPEHSARKQRPGGGHDPR